VDVHKDFLEMLCQTIAGCRKRQFSVLPLAIGLSSERLEIRPTLFCNDKESLIDFPLIPQPVTLNNLEWLFYVKICIYARTLRLGDYGCRRQLRAN